MIKHIVMWKLKKELREDIQKCNQVDVFYELFFLKHKIPQIKTFNAGINCNPENDYDIVLEIEFESMNDFNAYIEHPDHIRVVEFLEPYTEQLASIDFEL